MIALIFMVLIFVNGVTTIINVRETRKARAAEREFRAMRAAPIPALDAQVVFESARAADTVEQFMANMRTRVGPWGARP